MWACGGEQWGPIYNISYDLSHDYLNFIVRSTYESDLQRAADISLGNIADQFTNTVSDDLLAISQVNRAVVDRRLRPVLGVATREVANTRVGVTRLCDWVIAQVKVWFQNRRMKWKRSRGSQMARDRVTGQLKPVTSEPPPHLPDMDKPRLT